ncbi:MAG: hypothetical protein IH608_00135, partial [Proteobacteria bacterium]|nr:hypothetical protein [Pseudomonadota bacterium]
VPAETRQKNLKQYELYARDLVTHLHQKALKAQSAEDFRLAAAGYRTYLDFFKQTEVRDEIRVNYAETLFSARRFVEAGKQFEAIARDLPQSEREREENLYSAVLAYYSALQEKGGLSAYDKVWARSGLREAGRAYTREYPTAKNVPKVLFHVAWVAYDEGNFPVAVDEFSRYADAYPGTAEAVAAIHLILDAYNLTEDYEALVQYGHRALDRPDLAGADRTEIAEIVQAAESKVLYPLALAVAENWDAGKQGLMEFAQAHQDSAMGEQALQAVLASAAELGDLATLFPTASQLLEKYPDTEHLEQTLNLLVDTSLQTSQFRRLAFYLEEFAYRLPKHPTRAEVLWRAAQIRDRLGEAKAASNDYNLLLQAGLPKTAPLDDVVLAATRATLRAGDQGFALKLALDYRDRLKGASRIKNDVIIALLYREQGDLERSGEYQEKARDGFQRNLDLEDQELADAVAEMEFLALGADFERYAAMQLGRGIDNDVVQRKGDLYGALLKAYHKLMQSRSPRWALAACFRAYELNEEFSRFLREAPLPELPEDQRAQYIALVAEKARGYADRGAEYRAKCAELARKWEICDAELARFFLRDRSSPPEIRPAGTPVDADWLQRGALAALHTQALKDPKDVSAQAALATEYVRLGDHRQAVLIAEAALGSEDAPPDLKASLFNTLGVARCYAGEDPLAKDAFQAALRHDPEHLAAKVNLAGLYQHYEHLEKAQALYDSLGLSRRLDDSGDLIHPRSQELYDAFARSARL